MTKSEMRYIEELKTAISLDEKALKYHEDMIGYIQAALREKKARLDNLEKVAKKHEVKIGI